MSRVRIGCRKSNQKSSCENEIAFVRAALCSCPVRLRLLSKSLTEFRCLDAAELDTPTAGDGFRTKIDEVQAVSGTSLGAPGQQSRIYV